MDWAIASVASARVARLATSGPDGRLDLVPITFALVDAGDGGAGEVRLVTAVDHKPKTTRHLRRLDDIRARPEVAVLVDHYDDRDWEQLWWVRLHGSARVLDHDHDGLVDALVAKYPQYRQTRPAGPVIEVSLTTWLWWSAAGGSGRAAPTTAPEETEQP